MSTQRYAIVDDGGNVENIIVWDGESAYAIPDGYTLRTAKAGDEMPADEAAPDAVAPVGPAVRKAIETATSIADLKAALLAVVDRAT